MSDSRIRSTPEISGRLATEASGLTSSRWVGLVLGIVVMCSAVHGRQSAESQDVPPQPPEVIASNWAGQNIGQALEDLLPIIHPDPNSDHQEFISFRYTHWIFVASREYSFSLVPAPGSGPTFHWAALVRMPTQGPILQQLKDLRLRNPNGTLASFEPQIQIRTWRFDEATCPTIAVQAAKVSRLAFKAPVKFGTITLDAPSFEFHMESYGTKMSLSVDDRDFALAVWAQKTRSVLAQCGAPETAASKDDR
jgi:hypothetical protein